MKTLLQAIKRKCRRLAALLFLVISSLIPWRWLPSSNAVADAFKRGCRLADRIEHAVVLKLYTLSRGLAVSRSVIGHSRATEFAAGGFRIERDMLQEVLGWAARSLEYHGRNPDNLYKVIKVLRDGSVSAGAGHGTMNRLCGWPVDHGRPSISGSDLESISGSDLESNRQRMLMAYQNYEAARANYFEAKAAFQHAKACERGATA